jgi:hypothetical protein
MSRRRVPHCPTQPRDILPRDVTSATRPRAANPHIAALTEVVGTNCRRLGVFVSPCRRSASSPAGREENTADPRACAGGAAPSPLAETNLLSGRASGPLSREAGEGWGGGLRPFTLRSTLPQVAHGLPGSTPQRSAPGGRTFAPTHALLRRLPARSPFGALSTCSVIKRDPARRDETHWERWRLAGVFVFWSVSRRDAGAPSRGNADARRFVSPAQRGHSRKALRHARHSAPAGTGPRHVRRFLAGAPTGLGPLARDA